MVAKLVCLALCLSHQTKNPGGGSPITFIFAFPGVVWMGANEYWETPHVVLSCTVEKSLREELICGVKERDCLVKTPTTNRFSFLFYFRVFDTQRWGRKSIESWQFRFCVWIPWGKRIQLFVLWGLHLQNMMIWVRFANHSCLFSTQGNYGDKWG